MRYSLCILLLISLSRIAHASDLVKGEQVFKSCAACHSVGPNAKNKLGPELNGIVGRKWASSEGYSYSQDLLAGRDQGNIWDVDRLKKYIENPKNVAPKGKMPFAGIKDEKQREDLIAYLRQYNNSGDRSH